MFNTSTEIPRFHSFHWVIQSYTFEPPSSPIDRICICFNENHKHFQIITFVNFCLFRTLCYICKVFYVVSVTSKYPSIVKILNVILSLSNKQIVKKSILRIFELDFRTTRWSRWFFVNQNTKIIKYFSQPTMKCFQQIDITFVYWIRYFRCKFACFKNCLFI